MSAQTERQAFETWARAKWPGAPLHYIRDALPENHPHYGEYVNQCLQHAWVAWQARAASGQQEQQP